MNRICSVCKIEKDINLFEVDKRKPHGKAYRCKECKNKRDRANNKIKRATDKEWRDRYYNHTKNYRAKMKPIWQEQRYQNKFNNAVENNAQSNIYIRECKDCGKFDLYRKEPSVNKNHCLKCYRKYQNLGKKMHKSTIKKCIDCEELYLGKGRTKRCKQCNKKIARKRKRDYRRITGLRRSHKKRAERNGVYYEPVSRKIVFERDDWKCKICGIDTIKEPLKDNSAELDHIIPISKGGSHSYLNVQCLCRKCNNKKGDTLPIHLRRVA